MLVMKENISKKNRREIKRFIKFAVVGSIGFVVDFGTTYVFKEIVGLYLLVANAIGFTAAVISNFIFNRYWTYPDSRSKSLRRQLFLFACINLAGLGINSTIVYLLEPFFTGLLTGFPIEQLIGKGWLPAKLIATGVVMFWNFFVNRYWTYNDVE